MSGGMGTRRRPAHVPAAPRRAASARRSSVKVVKSTKLFGVPLAEVEYSDVIEIVNCALADRSKPTITIDAINTMGMSESCLDPRMREALLDYDVVVPDGMPLVWCMNAKGAALSDRVYGPYLADRLLAGLDRDTRVAVIGGFDDVHAWLRANGPSRYPRADFALLYDAPAGPVDDAYVADCVERIKRSRAQLVFVCLGVPRQYYWTALARRHLPGRVCVSVGGALDFVAGTRRYAPDWAQRAGLTWLHRLAHEPKRLGRRYLKYNSAFLWLLLRHEVLARELPRHAWTT